MQFIEKNSFNVRSALYFLERDDDAPAFVLFPMVHIGSREFYEEIYRRLSKCDLIFVEGVKSRRAALLTLSYEVVERIKRLGLVTQHTLRMADFRGKAINTDISTREFDSGWAALPLSIKLLSSLIIPGFILYLFFFGTRNFIAREIALEDLPSRDEILNGDESFEKWDDLLIARRDRNLIEAIKRFYEKNRSSKKVVGIVYGAAHMRGISNFLLEALGYKIRKAEWVKVFDL